MLFTGPALETVVQPAPTCGPSLYPTCTAREHLAAMATTKSKEGHYKRIARAEEEKSEKSASTEGVEARGEPGPSAQPQLASSRTPVPSTGAPASQLASAPAPQVQQDAIDLALAIAAEAGHVECTSLLITSGRTSTRAMATALAAAQRANQKEVTDLLSHALASANIRALAAPLEAKLAEAQRGEAYNAVAEAKADGAGEAGPTAEAKDAASDETQLS